MVLQRDDRSFATLVEAAVLDLDRQGWRTLRRGPAPPAEGQSRRTALGEALGLSSQLGPMEQWVAHRRPDGRYAFGPYVLNAHRWAATPPHASPAAPPLLGL
jgi:hypothetical protein